MSDFRNNTKCLYNDSGFCKYGEKCRKTHHKSICLRNNCDKKCNSRHPKPCKFKAKCKFLAKAICAFNHENDEQDLDDLKRQIESLKQENKDKKMTLLKLEEVLNKMKENEELSLKTCS